MHPATMAVAASASELPAFLQYGALGLLAAVLLGAYLLLRFALKAFARELKGHREAVEWIGRLLVQLRADVERIRRIAERDESTPVDVPRPTPRPFRAPPPIESMTAPRNVEGAPPTLPGRRKLPSRSDR